MVILYQGIMGNPSSLSLDALKKASLLKKQKTGVTLIQYKGFSKGGDLHMRLNNSKTL